MFKVCTRFLSLLTLCGTLCASDAAAATSVSVTATQMPRLKLFNVFSMANESTSSALASSSSTSRDASAISAEQAAVKEAASDFIVISELQSSASAVNGNQTAGGEDVSFLDFLTETYQTTTHKQILYNRTSWELIEEGSSHENLHCVWARFQFVKGSNDTSTCLVLAEWNQAWSDAFAADLVAYIRRSCGEHDVVALTLTSAASDVATQYMEGIATVNDTYSPLRMVEASHLLKQQQYVSSSVAIADVPMAVSNRLFLHLVDTMCADKAATPSSRSASENATTGGNALVLELCSGSDCQTCKPSHLSDDEKTSHASSGISTTLIVLLSCSAFLLTSTAVFCLLFRSHFFAPNESTKDEKELTTNLAYVLRI